MDGLSAAPLEVHLSKYRNPGELVFTSHVVPLTYTAWGDAQVNNAILPEAAEFVKQIVPTAEVRYFDGGHFVLDEYADAIAEAIIETFSR